MNHDLKCWPKFFEEILADKQRAELRINDRNFKLGDLLTIREFHTDARGYTGRHVVRVVTHIASPENLFPVADRALKPGWIIMSIAPVAHPNMEPVK